jgi:NADH dehydrogenase (ubiquinone) flavoprotein 2
MVQINDDYYEDLTPETMVELLTALKESANAVGKSSSSAKVPGPGPLSGRKSCENSQGLTSLRDEPWGAEKTRADL